MKRICIPLFFVWLHLSGKWVLLNCQGRFQKCLVWYCSVIIPFCWFWRSLTYVICLQFVWHMFWVNVFGGLLGINNKTPRQVGRYCLWIFHAGFEVFFKNFVAPHGSDVSKRMWSSYFLVRPSAGIRLLMVLFSKTYQNITELSFCQTVTWPK